MAGASAVSQFTYRVIYSRGFHFAVSTGFKVIAVAGGAVGLIRWKAPHIGFDIANMAIVAIQGAAMFSGVRAALVTEAADIPCSVAVAVVALAVGHKVIVVFAGGRYAVMARRAAAGYVAVIKTGW